MKSFKLSKLIYDNIEIPKELHSSVEQLVKREEVQETEKGRRGIKKIRYAASAAAVLLTVLIIGLNTNQAFAQGMAELPLVGNLVKVLTVRSYHEVKDNMEFEVNIPEIQTAKETETGKDALIPEGTDNTGTAALPDKTQNAIVDINAKIMEIVDNYTLDAEKRIADYKTAFLETGGTEKEWDERNFKVNVDYEVKARTEDYLSLVLTGDEDWSGAYGIRYYYNLTLKTGENLTLKDLLGEDFKKLADTQIKAEMDKRVSENPDYMYFSEAEGGFTGITDETNFYINSSGNPVIVFDKYEVAPGFMGRQEFEIRK